MCPSSSSRARGRSWAANLSVVALAALLFLGAVVSGAAAESAKKADSTRTRVATEVTVDASGIRVQTSGGTSKTPAPPESPEPPEPPTPLYEGDDWVTTGSDVVRFGEDIVIEREERVFGDVVAVGGSIEVYGKVSGDVVSVGGEITLHDGSEVSGEAVSVGGVVHKDEGSEVRGQVVSVNVGIPGLIHPMRFVGLRHYPGPNFGSLIRLAGWIVGLALFAGLAVLFVLIFGPQVERISAAITRDTLRAMLVGLLAMVVMPPLIILLVVTVIGIPAAVLAGVLWFLGDLFGMVAVSLAAGGRLTGPLKVRPSPYLAVILGTAALFAALVLGSVFCCTGFLSPFGWFFIITGLLLMTLASLVGLGGVVMTRFGTRVPGQMKGAGTGAPAVGPGVAFGGAGVDPSASTPPPGGEGS